MVEAVAAERGERVNTFCESRPAQGEHDLKLWGELNHGSRAQQTEAQSFDLC